MLFSVFVLVDLFVLWCSFQDRIPLADGLQEDREQTDSINQGVNRYSYGVFRNIKDIWVGSANTCLLLVPKMLAGFSRGLASRQFPRILEEMLIVRCEFPGSFKTTRYVRLVFQYMLGEGVSFVLSGFIILQAAPNVTETGYTQIIEVEKTFPTSNPTTTDPKPIELDTSMSEITTEAP